MRRYVLLSVLIGSIALLNSSTTPTFTKRDKAYYLDQATVNFVRPGLVVKILSAQIAPDGTISTQFQVTDLKGLPLDRTGVTTPGNVSTSFIAAYLPKGQEQYVAYTTRPQKSPITGNSATQAGTDQGGAYTQNGDGLYTYTFGTKAPAGFDATVTTSIGVYASRDLSEFDLGTQYSNDVLNFVPDGSPVTQTRDVVDTATCNQCHDPLEAHLGARQLVKLCVLCHTPQTTDPDTGNTVDFKVMIHKIHMGAQLPSVQAGQPYQIIGFQQSVNDFSTVVFPAVSPANCQMCHKPGPAQANAWLTNPSRAACGSCHDNVNFATGENHVNLPQVSDNLCSQCHIPQGENEFDASIIGTHTIPQFSKQLPGVVFTLDQVTDGTIGKNPTVAFSVKDNAGNPI
ncbi:MAG: OmcA/MtrC family decaheme c-type cytochrome, partial [Acidobacteria bacterium]|nr:OmcA/MtrC family decaheme c-type cytochrome [Acidobacteriota bacterium]